MSKLNINAVALAIGFAFSAGAMAEGMSKTDYKAGMTKISAEYKTDKAACSAFSGNASDICKAEAKSKEKVAAAELEASYQPTSKHRYEARLAKAEGDYAVAKEKCDDMSGNAKDQHARIADEAMCAPPLTGGWVPVTVVSGQIRRCDTSDSSTPSVRQCASRHALCDADARLVFVARVTAQAPDYTKIITPFVQNFTPSIGT